MNTQALRFTQTRTIEVQERPTPAPKHDELLVEVRACGVCHGDVELFWSERANTFPTYAGHEAAGTVRAVGDAVDAFAVGDNVALLGQERFSTYTVARQHQAIAIPQEITSWSNWIIEPMACCVNGAEVAGVEADDVVAVVGCGFMGLGLIQCLQLTPARLTAAFALRERSLELARENGADVTILATDRERAVATTRDCVKPRPMPHQYEVPGFEGGPCDVVFEASGTASGLALASDLVRVGGTLVLFGHQVGETVIDGTQWHMRGIRVLNASPMIARDFHSVFYRTAGLLAYGRVNMEKLISHQSDFRDAQTLFGESKSKEYLKGVLTFDAAN